MTEGAVQVTKEDAAAVPALPRRLRSTSDSTMPSAPDAHAEPLRTAERLEAGQAVNLAADGAIGSPVAVNIEHVTAWRQRRLVFEWETLAAIAEEFNRYNRTPQLRVEGEEVRARRYTAVFDADNPQALLRFLARDSDLIFAADGGDFVIGGR